MLAEGLFQLRKPRGGMKGRLIPISSVQPPKPRATRDGWGRSWDASVEGRVAGDA